MDSWANTDKTYPGQGGADIPNKQQPSQEKQATGFAPTYIDVQGNLVIGDGLTAQEINYILNDLYDKYKALLARANQP
ncbi:TPA: phosphoglycolate phosphatase [Citrobacter braakii]|uniref:phosphoglycolate phosphatase n=1 Tax=Citrobacter braakii TaxID=57706 RepID=UPI0015E9758B|nr:MULTISPECIES: phosphoglycolate phosphatase [Citrobacter freundii complex]MBJ8954450.1 phosphoglycolate phosphatase [Citrobacter braakii]QLX25496.1 phosphoglycolate phosphatase [Citrobacter freundii]HEE9910236.1 phosphoglycolate phosphatase [Citrobacter braakii]